MDQGQNMKTKPVALIIGTGIGGLSCAVALKKVGWSVRLFEKADSMRATGSGLSVMSNASAAMKKLLDIDLGLEHYGAEIRNFEIRHKSGFLLKRLPFQEIAEEQGSPSVCISRQQLQTALLDNLGKVDISHAKRFASYSESDDAVHVTFEDETRASGDILVGADGYYSAVRDAMGIPSQVQEAGYICWLALVKYDHPQISPGYVVHYWGKGKRIGIIDIGGGWVYWWGTANMSNQRQLAGQAQAQTLPRSMRDGQPSSPTLFTPRPARPSSQSMQKTGPFQRRGPKGAQRYSAMQLIQCSQVWARALVCP